MCWSWSIQNYRLFPDVLNDRQTLSSFWRTKQINKIKRYDAGAQLCVQTCVVCTLWHTFFENISTCLFAKAIKSGRKNRIAPSTRCINAALSNAISFVEEHKYDSPLCVGDSISTSWTYSQSDSMKKSGGGPTYVHPALFVQFVSAPFAINTRHTSSLWESHTPHTLQREVFESHKHISTIPLTCNANARCKGVHPSIS